MRLSRFLDIILFICEVSLFWFSGFMFYYKINASIYLLMVGLTVAFVLGGRIAKNKQAII